MELELTRQTGTQVIVTCDGKSSHSFDLLKIIPDTEKGPPQPINDPVTYGKAIYNALFLRETPSQLALDKKPARILLVAPDHELDAVQWEYAYGTYGNSNTEQPGSSENFLVLECHFVRGLPAKQRIDPPVLDVGLHIIAVPSYPLSSDVEPLNIDSEWIRLKEIIQKVPYAFSLERTRPPTLEQVRHLVANQRHRVIHFMGHGGQRETGTVLSLEKDNGDLDLVTDKKFVVRVHNTVFLVTLNACVSATPGPTDFSNIAAALVHQKTPYALGMRFSIHDDDSRAFSRAFYSDLASGVPIEDALFQARLTLVNSPRSWVIGVPVLYTALAQPAVGFICITGIPTIKEHQPKIEADTLPRAEGVFQGRIDELKQLGDFLTSDSRPRLMTILGSGGQGKTALAREAIERFAFAWLGGVWATTLVILPSREAFVNDLARFLGINTQGIMDPGEIERQVLARLALHRTLIVLDNAETLVDAVEANNTKAIQLGQFIQQLPRSTVSLLVTSRVQLGWSDEVTYELPGLLPKEGAVLFRKCAPQRMHEIEPTSAWDLSVKLEGHPLSLRILGSAFNSSGIALHDFIAELEVQLMTAENKYRELDHRHRSLYASIDISVRYLDKNLRSLLSGLQLFHAPFLPETAIAIFDPETKETEQTVSPVRDYLYTLWKRSLLTHKTISVSDGTSQFYHLLPTMHPYLKKHVEQAYEQETLMARFGTVYAQLADSISSLLDTSAKAVTIAQQARLDLEQGIEYLTGIEQGYYLMNWGWILYRLGNSHQGLELLERAVESAQGQNRSLEWQASINIALLYRATGQLQHALAMCQQTLLLVPEMGNPTVDAYTLNTLAMVYSSMGQRHRALELYQQVLEVVRKIESSDTILETTMLFNIAFINQVTGDPQRALEVYQQILPIIQKAGDRLKEAALLSEMAGAYSAIGQRRKALELYQQILPIQREIGNSAGEAAALGNIASVYLEMGEFQRALELYQQALPLLQKVDDRNGEANLLSGMAMVYRHVGNLQRALNLCQQALLIVREVGNRHDEAKVLVNITLVYQDIGELQRAQELCQQALLILQEIGDRAGEATTLNNLAGAYYAQGQTQQALALLQQALSIMQETGNRPEEAITLCNIAMYRTRDEPQQALELYQQALLLQREVGNRSGEAHVLNGIAMVHLQRREPQQALESCLQALSIMREVGDLNGENSTLYNMALIYEAMEQPQRALELYKQALSMIKTVGWRVREANVLCNMAKVYRDIGQRRQALELYQQALSIRRELDSSWEEADIFYGMAGVYRDIGQPQRALELYQQALPVVQEKGNLFEEASMLSNMAEVYRATGELPEALKLYQQALSIVRKVGNLAGEAAVLTNITLTYQDMGALELALESCQQALSIHRELDDRTGVAITLNNLARIYQAKGEPQQALVMFRQALPIMRQVVNRAEEAKVLNNMALANLSLGEPQRTLELCQQALPIMQEVGDRSGEAFTLNNMALAYQALGQSQQALALFQQALVIMREVSNPGGEALTLSNIALVLYQSQNQRQEAISQMERAIAILVSKGLTQDVAGQIVSTYQQTLKNMQSGASFEMRTNDQNVANTLPIQSIVKYTILAMTEEQDRRTEWREAIAQMLQGVQQEFKSQNEAELLIAILAILDGQSPSITHDHPYAQVVTAIKAGIAEGGLKHEEASQADDLPFDAELIPRSIAALVGSPQEKMEHAQYLTAMSTQTKDEGLIALIQVIQLALFGSELSQPDQHLSGVYREVWEAIIIGAETEGLDLRLFEGIAYNTLAVLGPAADKRDGWRNDLKLMRDQAMENGGEKLVAFLDTVIGLLDAEGNPAGLGTNLTGIYAQTWQAILERLS